MTDWIRSLIERTGLQQEASDTFVIIVLAVSLILLCAVGYWIAKKVIIGVATRIAKRSKNNWDDMLLQHKVFHRAAHLVPAILISAFAGFFPVAGDWLSRAAGAYSILVILLIVDAALSAANDIYRTFEISRTRPIKGLLQVIKIFVFIVGGVIIVAGLMGESPLVLLGGIGAMTAVTSLVFKDSILGFVAGIQLSGNDMVRIGDWIEMPQYAANGTVIDISLNTVKVENFDYTITTIPAYALVSDAFKNWRGMEQSGGRRINRAIYIDTSSITICTPEMLERFKKIAYISDYIESKEKEIAADNLAHRYDASEPVNGRRMTNIGTFRAYITGYLRNHPGIHPDMIQMVRQLPTEGRGLPLDIYAFTNTTNWVEYEGIQADIFDHLLAVAPQFGLQVFQEPTGYDFKHSLAGQQAQK